MAILNQNDAIILIIDIQEKLLSAAFNNEVITAKSQIITKAAEILHIPIIATEQYPKGLGSTINELKQHADDCIQYFEKNTFSALETPEILEAIKRTGKKQVIVLGIETHICVSQTVQSLLQQNFDVFVIKDACGSRSQEEHCAGLDRIREQGAQIVTTEIILFEILKSSKHPNFKEIQALIK